MRNALSFRSCCGFLVCLVFALFGQSQTTNGIVEPETVGDIPALVSAIVGRIAATNCKGKRCTVAIPEYQLPDGNITVYGARIADAVARELIKRGYKVEGIEQVQLRTYLREAPISLISNNRDKICQMGHKLKARFVVLGMVERADEKLAKISTFVIDADSPNCDPGRVIVGRGPLPPADDLEPIYVGDPSQKIADMIWPNCDYMPNPRYPGTARAKGDSGTVTVAAVINIQGQLEALRIIHGLTPELNEATLATMRTWRCSPATKDKKPVATLVQFQVNFRIY